MYPKDIIDNLREIFSEDNIQPGKLLSKSGNSAYVRLSSNGRVVLAKNPIEANEGDCAVGYIPNKGWIVIDTAGQQLEREIIIDQRQTREGKKDSSIADKYDVECYITYAKLAETEQPIDCVSDVSSYDLVDSKYCIKRCDDSGVYSTLEDCLNNAPTPPEYDDSQLPPEDNAYYVEMYYLIKNNATNPEIKRFECSNPPMIAYSSVYLSFNSRLVSNAPYNWVPLSSHPLTKHLNIPYYGRISALGSFAVKETSKYFDLLDSHSDGYFQLDFREDGVNNPGKCTINSGVVTITDTSLSGAITDQPGNWVYIDLNNSLGYGGSNYFYIVSSVGLGSFTVSAGPDSPELTTPFFLENVSIWNTLLTNEDEAFEVLPGSTFACFEPYVESGELDHFPERPELISDPSGETCYYWETQTNGGFNRVRYAASSWLLIGVALDYRNLSSFQGYLNQIKSYWLPSNSIWTDNWGDFQFLYGNTVFGCFGGDGDNPWPGGDEGEEKESLIWTGYGYEIFVRNGDGSKECKLPLLLRGICTTNKPSTNEFFYDAIFFDQAKFSSTEIDLYTTTEGFNVNTYIDDTYIWVLVSIGIGSKSIDASINPNESINNAYLYQTLKLFKIRRSNLSLQSQQTFEYPNVDLDSIRYTLKSLINPYILKLQGDVVEATDTLVNPILYDKRLIQFSNFSNGIGHWYEDDITPRDYAEISSSAINLTIPKEYWTSEESLIYFLSYTPSLLEGFPGLTDSIKFKYHPQIKRTQEYITGINADLSELAFGVWNFFPGTSFTNNNSPYPLFSWLLKASYYIKKDKVIARIDPKSLGIFLHSLPGGLIDYATTFHSGYKKNLFNLIDDSSDVYGSTLQHISTAISESFSENGELFLYTDSPLNIDVIFYTHTSTQIREVGKQTVSIKGLNFTTLFTVTTPLTYLFKNTILTESYFAPKRSFINSDALAVLDTHISNRVNTNNSYSKLSVTGTVFSVIPYIKKKR